MFCSQSEEALTIFLDADFSDMDMICKEKDDMPLIHYCIARGILSKAILKRLKFQINLRWRDWLPIEFGKFNNSFK